MEPLGIDGAWTISPQIHRDNRGSFLEWYSGGEFTDNLGYRFEVAQVNCAVSRRGAIRGIHFTDVPPGQAKYVMCVSGAAVDVVVDLRIGSPCYGQWATVRLDDQARRGLFVSEGLGHGLMALTPEATVLYMCSSTYSPAREHSVHPLDPALGIAWPSDIKPVLSQKDAHAPGLAEARKAGLLPRYEDCLAFARDRIHAGAG
jgi:dTDP-4-dehydrorhamnose 3,5-epimerase